MVQTGMSAPFGAATPTGFPAQNGDVKPADEKAQVPLLPPPTGTTATGTGPPFSPPPPQSTTTGEQPTVSIVNSPAMTQNQQPYKMRTTTPRNRDEWYCSASDVRGIRNQHIGNACSYRSL
jgi:hypothetical protein